MEKNKNSVSMRSFGRDITNIDRNEIGQTKKDLKQIKKQVNHHFGLHGFS